MDKIALEVTHLSKIYRLYNKPIDRLKESLGLHKKLYHKEFYALNDLNFNINKGETIGIIGTNGSGKSTLLKIITGVLNPSMGEIIVNGKISALLELGAGFNPEYTGYENIYLNGSMFGFTISQIDEKVQSIIDFAGIGDFIYQPIKNYSSGMFARLAFAVAIHVDPDILIVDEVLAVGDLEFQLKCMDKFNEFRNLGKTIIYVSHDINSVKRYCNSCIWIQNGKIEAIGKTDNVTDRYLDYLKRDIIEETEVVANENCATIGQINSIKLMNSSNIETDNIVYNENVTVEIEYELFKIISKPVVGVAIRSLDNKYICGLNTKLDYFEISNGISKNIICLEYNNFNLIGGSYYLDVALFESNAHVPIEYKGVAKRFIVQSPYVGEGVFVMKHKWYMKG